MDLLFLVCHLDHGVADHPVPQLIALLVHGGDDVLAQGLILDVGHLPWDVVGNRYVSSTYIIDIVLTLHAL